jgi:arylsulfatase
VLDVLGVEAPATIKGHVQSNFDGVSMRYSLDDGAAPTTRHTQFYSMLGRGASGTTAGRRSPLTRR